VTRFLGLDLGATNSRAVVGDGSGTVMARRARPTPTAEGSTVAAALRDLAVDVCADADVDPAGIAAAGIASIGPLDRSGGRVVDTPNHPATEIQVVDPIADVVDGDVTLFNDATAAAVGERFYADGDVENLDYVTISSGIGAGAIVDGRPLSGATGNAVEAGHFVLDPDGPALCGCGGAGHWEGFASGENLAEFARYLAATADVNTRLDLDAVDAAALYRADDPLAAAVRERAGRWHARGVASLVHAYDPALVAIGGAVARENPQAVVGAIRDHLPTLVTPTTPTIRETALGPDASVKGALACALTAGTGVLSP
jgi:glucokinase